MAVATSKKSAQPARKVASLNPEDMVAGGLPSDFDGECTEADFRPYNYPKADGTAMDHYVLCLHLYIEPDASSGYDPFDVYISAGSLDNHVPSKDGATPVPIHDVPDGQEPGEECVGYFAVQVNKKEGLGKDTKLGHFMRALIDAGFDMVNLADGDVRGLIGLYGHWDLIEYKSKGGNTGGVSADGTKKRNDLLVLTEIKERPKAAKPNNAAVNRAATTTAARKAATVVEPEPAAEASEAEDNPLVDIVNDAIIEMIAEAGGSLLETKVAPKLMLALKKTGNSSEAITLIRANNGALLRESELWSYDAASKSLSL